MGRELYQLVAIDKNNNQYVIELNNLNKKNRGSLEFIDSGTVRFANEQHLANYLHKKGKIPTKDVNFFIKYKHNGDKYLPVIYNDRDLFLFLGFNDSAKYDYILRFFRLIEIEFSKRYFYDFFVSENKTNSNQSNNGNFLNNKLFFDLLSYYDTYIRTQNYESSRVDLQYSILSELFNYKQFRTMHQFYKTYAIESMNTEKMPDYENLPDVPDDIRHAYETNGMDCVYGIVDRDYLESKGIRLK